MTNREAAIEWFSMLKKKFVKTEYEGYLDLAISAMEKQEQDRRISVKDRLPEDYSDVLVWFEYFRYGSYNRLYQTYGIGNYSAEYDAWTVNHESGWNKLRVIAWRPLPEQYKEEES